MLEAEDIHFYQQVFKNIDPRDLVDLFQLAEARTLAAGEIYIREGSTTPRLAYIRNGLLRAWCKKENDDEITLMLRWENQFVASIDTIIHRKPSRYIYQALEETTLIEVDYDAAMAIIDQSARLSASRSAFLLHMLSMSVDRVEAFVLLSPEERYRKMINDKPDIINRVADKYLATFLGITPVSLSRIRKRMASAATPPRTH